jgi:hypothetical protein
VVVARWTLSMIEDFPEYEALETDQNGAFAMEKLAPGTYRAARVDSTAWLRSQMPGVLADWIAHGQEFTVAEDERKVLRVDLRIDLKLPGQ